ncbi:putative mitochondrial 2,3-bisphosphoglycerate-independent phosphoglycerate mutase [Leptomonas pyrrhocoris]|uniref:Putative mitochondrial 2,3-bisphosphoglycerate-independent phosphoglycerate mutase n=1 Tax=Leptomonas pyrrhocoris TaxID=157538 RepID=A0A0N0DZE1_LEPPY|nr:putative mitochondrial 2,3-bisphosphoglycerate-independent phosphoglycerate mutase [Leptomonas pyrrhocoris]XP_015663635.1 putative mitochondrial 2,3-bisphosphoglycerate-independent phosphoglycerate mutase [Leptomonas pyrrhocoris]KPA85195.1 putative mitochondrial 2,3-bisphosphoglycerate-independent phosphoglycerate mutase [Leptomonas pyrrhocoris]KPA85196.1 putative mitochondrial 2,3-bisphosphoglycerate-independent phosphoglycerate mutase [Leptomonas pyrrhocoris]|eukprot:XP_015663634.1 putative mitochondrial 2,3-bisphosphoglycerate-independent phosphoglycerate mutase [Leptomonas pyrrhocoris]
MSSLPTLVFVYGTLLRGENNYPYWLAEAAEAVFIARARTVHRYPLFVNFLPEQIDCSPCVLDLPDCNVTGCAQVEGELFAVSDKMKAWLDVLEDISGGTYVSVATAIEVCEAPSASYRQRAGSIPHAIPCPTTASAELAVVTAALYFRAKNYPSDWAAPSPKSSSKLLVKFSAAEMLRTYGKRFNGGLPAHLRDGPSGTTAVAMQKELNALPEAYWPPSTRAYHTMAARHPDVPTPSHGAPLFPKPMVLFIIDGIGDNTYSELGRRTPLEVVAGVPAVAPLAASSAGPVFSVVEEVLPVAEVEPCNTAAAAALRATVNTHVTPGINIVARHGVNGVMDPYMAGKSCGSDTAHLSLFGYPPTMYYRGRGAYEALGAGLELEDEDVAFKSNFSTFADPAEELCGDEDPALEAKAIATTAPTDQYVTHRRCDRDFTQEGPLLCQDLNGMTVPCDLHGVPFDYPHTIKMQYATEHRCGVALSGARRVLHADGTSAQVLGMLSDKITGTDPLKDGRLLLHCTPTVAEDHPEYAAALYTCRLVEAASAALTKRLRSHPVNDARRQHNRNAAAAHASNADSTGSPAAARKNIANLILFRGAAKKGWVPTFAVRHGLCGLILAPTCIIKGLGICCGLRGEVCAACDPSGQASLRGATGDYHSDLMVKVRAALHALRIECPKAHEGAVTHSLSTATAAEEVSHIADVHYNFVVVHVKGVDDAGHDKSLAQKLEMLRRSGLALEALWEALPAGSTVAVIADHSTPLAVGDHCCEPVPVSVAVKGAGPTEGDGAATTSAAGPCDAVQLYSEVLAASGALGRFRGDELIPLMKHVHHHYHYT